MNCQDISRFADTGNIRNLGAAERHAAELHARSCRECAPAWGVQLQLAGLRVPKAPAQIAMRLQMLTALPDQPARWRSPRWLVMAGSLVAVVAASALLTIRWADTPVVEPSQSPPVVVATQVPAEVEPELPPVTAVAKDVGPVSAEPLPLLPPPTGASEEQTKQGMWLFSQRDSALEKAVERHPELVEGPEIDGTFVVGIALRTDGSVFTSAVRQSPPGSYATASAEIDALVPGETSFVDAARPKSTPLRDGRRLRGKVVMTVRSMPDGFDVARSRARVLQILGDRYAHLLTPASNDELNRLEVFLSEDGSILRERVDHVRSGDAGTNVVQDPADIARFAEGIAARLGVDVRQIGMVGLTRLSRADTSVATEAGGGASGMEGTQRLLVNYAWARRSGESAPTLGSGGSLGINQTVALALVERYIPDAFTRQDPAAGQPAVILTAKGEFSRTARMWQKSTQTPDLRRPAGDAQLTGVQSVRLTNAAGVTIDVSFGWEVPKTEPVN